MVCIHGGDPDAKITRSPAWIAARHGGKGCDAVVKKMDTALRTFVEAATR
jgi:hypothetical protein